MANNHSHEHTSVQCDWKSVNKRDIENAGGGHDDKEIKEINFESIIVKNWWYILCEK